MNDWWKELKIEKTFDLKTIKMAYAERIKQVHPEEDPEGFKQLQAAYKQATQYAKSQKHPTVDTDSIYTEPTSTKNDETNSQISDTASQTLIDFLEICRQSPSYSILLTFLKSDAGHLINAHFFRSKLIEELVQIQFSGSEQQRAELIEYCYLLNLEELARYFETSSYQIFEDGFEVEKEKFEQEAELYLNKLLQEFDLATDFYLLLKAIRTERFAYYLQSQLFSQQFTEQLLNYYFYGDWQNRIELVQYLQQYGLYQLADYIYRVGLKNPENQLGITTEI
jgi:predicted RNA-binding protein Jag